MSSSKKKDKSSSSSSKRRKDRKKTADKAEKPVANPNGQKLKSEPKKKGASPPAVTTKLKKPFPKLSITSTVTLTTAKPSLTSAAGHETPAIHTTTPPPPPTTSPPKTTPPPPTTSLPKTPPPPPTTSPPKTPPPPPTTSPPKTPPSPTTEPEKITTPRLKNIVAEVLKWVEESKHIYVEKVQGPKKPRPVKAATPKQSPKTQPKSDKNVKSEQKGESIVHDDEEKLALFDLKAKTPSLESRESVVEIQESIKRDITDAISPEDLNDIAILFDVDEMPTFATPPESPISSPTSPTTSPTSSTTPPTSPASTATIPPSSPSQPATPKETPEEKQERLIKAASLYWETKNREQVVRDLLKLFLAVRLIFKEEARCIKVKSPVYVFGDIHGNLFDLTQFGSIFFNRNEDKKESFVFLGDYVDRGHYGLECILYLFCLKIQQPKTYFLIRGNHEERSVQKDHTYLKECEMKFGDRLGKRVWEASNRAFDNMPLSALIDDKIFCCHGGIPKSVLTIEGINSIPTALNDPINQSDAAWEILWSDPVSPRLFEKYKKERKTDSDDLAMGYIENDDRGAGYYFSELALKNFFSYNGLTNLIRGHEVFQDGFNVYLGGKAVTVFSSSDYSDDNSAAVVYVTEDNISILIVDTSIGVKEKATRVAQTIQRTKLNPDAV